jgi:hypothetical protein
MVLPVHSCLKVAHLWKRNHGGPGIIYSSVFRPFNAGYKVFCLLFVKCLIIKMGKPTKA